MPIRSLFLSRHSSLLLLGANIKIILETTKFLEGKVWLFAHIIIMSILTPTLSNIDQCLIQLPKEMVCLLEHQNDGLLLQ